MDKKINIFPLFSKSTTVGKIVNKDLTENDEVYKQLQNALKKLQDTPTSNWQMFGIPTSVINKIIKFHKRTSPTVSDLIKDFGGTHLEYIVKIIEAGEKIKQIEQWNNSQKDNSPKK